VIGLANAGADAVNAIKQAAEFGIVKGGQKIAGLLVTTFEVHALGLEVAQGLLLTMPFYWDHDDATRAFAARFAQRMGGKKPSFVHAGVYAGVAHYLKAVKELGASTDGRAVVAKMKAMPTDDPLFGKGSIRVDGRKIHPMYLYEVKKPSESSAPWDYQKLVQTIPAEEAFRPGRGRLPAGPEVGRRRELRPLRTARARPDQRGVLCPDEPRAGDHLRPPPRGVTSRTAPSTPPVASPPSCSRATPASATSGH
jgi:hypothetical protein